MVVWRQALWLELCCEVSVVFPLVCYYGDMKLSVVPGLISQFALFPSTPARLWAQEPRAHLLLHV